MKVLVVSHLYPAPGHERHLFVHEQVLALRALGVEMRVVSPTGYAPRALWRVHPRVRRRGQTPAHAVRDAVAIDYPRVPVLPRMLLFSHSGDLFWAAMRRHLPAWRAEGFDLVHAHQAMPDGAAARHLAAALGVPYVVTVHGRDVNFHLLQRGAIADETAAVLSSAAAVSAVSGTVARRLAPYVAPQRLFVNNNGVVGLDQTSEPADFAPGKPLLLSVGYLIASKGHRLVLEAVAGLRNVHPDLEYAIIGEGLLRNELAVRARELGIAERVHFLGRVPHPDVLAMMARADAFVQPSAPEGFGLVYTEALAQGTPVVACRGEGPEDFVEDGVSGLLVPPGDAGAVTAAIARLLANPAAARAMGAAGQRVVRTLTWERNAALQKEIYEAAAGEARRRPVQEAEDT